MVGSSPKSSNHCLDALLFMEPRDSFIDILSDIDSSCQIVSALSARNVIQPPPTIYPLRISYPLFPPSYGFGYLFLNLATDRNRLCCLENDVRLTEAEFGFSGCYQALEGDKWREIN